MEQKAVRAQQEIERREVNLLAELATSQRLQGNLDTALRFGVRAGRLALALDQDGAGISAVDATLATVLWQTDWRLVLSRETAVSSAAFSPDGTADRSARIWHAATAKEIAVLRGHGEIVRTRPRASGTLRRPRRSQFCAAMIIR